jgi:signal transduction histidine kinase/signal recognition particle receptor subunit beta
MAQWSRADRTLYTKLVYYGPAFGGKTTNLQSLHRITDPQGKYRLLSLKTADDRTLFFDLLPFDLGDILGYQVAMKLYTVPGQVRYDTTRQVVLSGADALVFVADSTASRRDKNVWSLQNLHMNMRANGLDPAKVPILFQFNKQDLPDAAPPKEVAKWLNIPEERGFPAVATEGTGVLETFMSACRAMLHRIVSAADDRTRREIDDKELDRQIDRAFGPCLARKNEGALPEAKKTVPVESTPVSLHEEDLLERSVRTSVRLGEKLSAETARATRLEREAEAFRRLSESLRSVGASFDRARIIDAALEASASILAAPVVTLVQRDEDGNVVLERGRGCEREPLLCFESGSELLRKMVERASPCVVDDLAAECGADAPSIRALRAAAAVPVESDGTRCLVAYAPQPDGSLQEGDLRFLGTVAGHLSAGLEKSRMHEDLAKNRDALEETVASRTRQLRRAYEELRSLQQTKDTFLANLSHEMKTPLTSILSSAVVLRDYPNDESARAEMVGQVVQSAETLQRLLDDLFRLVNLESASSPLELVEVTPKQLLEEAIAIAGKKPSVRFEIKKAPQRLRVDLPRVARALANLVDNAVKFSPPGSPVTLRVEALPGAGPADPVTLAVSVLDRGPGVPPADRERIFGAFEQGGDPMTSKPAGIGIGLHEARSVARRHGGDVVYVPRNGGGSEFRMTVPLEPVGEPAVAAVAGS